MSGGIVLPISTEFVFSGFEECRAALLNRDLSRTFDDRTYAEGNVRQGNVSTIHGVVHRNRRRLENPMFRSERLELYERTLFPRVMERLLARLAVGGTADLLIMSEMLSLVLSAVRAGIDHDEDDLDELHRLVEFINRFSQGSAIIDTAGDAEAVRADVMAAMAGWELDFLQPSRARREAMLAAWRAGELAESELLNDVLTLLLRHRDEAEFGLDDGVIARETATYLHGGAHTSSQTLVNTVDILMSHVDSEPGIWAEVIGDRQFAQRCVHETLRLRPTTPRLKRRAVATTRVGDVEIPEASLVIIDVGTANRDERIYGAEADTFDPMRIVPERAYRWGLTFGAGGHQCPGRNVAVGLPVPDDPAGDAHLFGLVTLMLQAVARLEPSGVPDSPPARDTRTVRWTRWGSYPVRFAAPPAG